jgi:hypothetical protein
MKLKFFFTFNCLVSGEGRISEPAGLLVDRVGHMVDTRDKLRDVYKGLEGKQGVGMGEIILIEFGWD